MKKLFVFAGVVAAAIFGASCSKQISVNGEEFSMGSGECILTVGLGSQGTKVAAQTVTNEKTIQNVQVYVFRAGDGADNGMLEVAASKGFDTPLNNSTGTYSGITVKCATGQREVWVVVNDSQDRTAISGDGAIKTKTEFLAQVHDLENSNATKLLMIGRSNPDNVSPVITLNEGPQNVNIPVHHMAAAITLESVINDFSSPAYQKANTFRLEAAYIMNVPGRYNFGESSEPAALAADYWYAKMAAETGAARKVLLYDEIGTPSAPAYVNYGGTAYSTPHTFYTYPNNCAPSEDSSWSTRATLLVVEASILYGTSWQKYYYPVVINPTGGLLSNKQYHVNITVHRPGSLDPNKPVKFSDMTPVITVTDFEDGGTMNPEI